MSPRLIDVHCHVQIEDYESDRSVVITRSLDQGIGMIIVGTTLKDSLEAVRVAEQYEHDPVYAAVGVHPTDGDLGEIHPVQLATLFGSKKVVAIGETGLDYYRLDPADTATRQLQADVFEQHLLLAGQHNLPVIIHTRDRQNVFDAYDDILAILTRHQVSRFVMHTYGGDWARAEQFLDLGGYLSFSGIVTFPKSEMAHDVARRAPADRILVETDAPFLTPMPHRGQRNEPIYVDIVAQQLATIRNVSGARLADTTLENTKTLFRL